MENLLSGLWKQILQIDRIGVNENFFEIGGDSIKGMQLLCSVQEATGAELSITTLFQAPTVEQLATILSLSQKGWSTPPGLVIPLQPNGSERPFFCHGASRGMAIHVGADQPFYGLRPHGQDGRRSPSTVEDMAADYIKQIRIIQPDGPYFLGGYSFGGIVQQLKKQSEKVALLFMLDSHFPGDDIPDSPKRSILSHDNIYRHLHNVDVLQTRRAKLTYILLRATGTIKGKINEKTARIRKILKKGVCKLYLAVDRRIPLSLRRISHAPNSSSSLLRLQFGHSSGVILDFPSQQTNR